MWQRDAETERLLDEFVQHQRAVAGLGGGTLANYRSSVRGFAQWCCRNGRLRLENVEPADVEAWLITRADGGAKPHTREGLLYALRACYRWLRPEAANPAEQVRRPRYARRSWIPTGWRRPRPSALRFARRARRLPLGAF